MTEAAPRVLIAGAGLGGLAAALALLRAGVDVDVYEQSAALGEVGAGVQISANGTGVGMLMNGEVTRTGGLLSSKGTRHLQSTRSLIANQAKLHRLYKFVNS